MIYRVEITYPNGNVEEIGEEFYSLDDAINYGNSLLGQVGYNAKFHKGGDGVQPFFIVLLRDEEGSKIVYDSKTK